MVGEGGKKGKHRKLADGRRWCESDRRVLLEEEGKRWENKEAREEREINHCGASGDSNWLIPWLTVDF